MRTLIPFFDVGSYCLHARSKLVAGNGVNTNALQTFSDFRLVFYSLFMIFCLHTKPRHASEFASSKKDSDASSFDLCMKSSKEATLGGNSAEVELAAPLLRLPPGAASAAGRAPSLDADELDALDAFFSGST